jgi:hypothetical protein
VTVCIHLFQKSRHLDLSLPPCCLAHGLLESSDHRTCQEVSNEAALTHWSATSLCVVHLLERQVGFFLGFESHKTESAASVGISVFDDDLENISSRTWRLPDSGYTASSTFPKC